jgi:phage-related minor tail protein
MDYAQEAVDMAELSVKIKAVDELSNAFEKMSGVGARTVEQFDAASGAISDTFDKATTGAESAAKAADTASNSFQTITKAFVAVGLTKVVNNMISDVMDMANAFSDAESIIAKSTGAIGSELEKMSSSMMNVFSNVPDAINDVATVLSTLNTATGVTGAGLETLTEQVLKFARVNNEGAGASAQTLGRLMNAMDMDASQLSRTMDQLTLASQMSGLGVNAMSEYVIAAGPSFEEMGFSMERSIATIQLLLSSRRRTERTAVLVEHLA